MTSQSDQRMVTVQPAGERRILAELHMHCFEATNETWTKEDMHEAVQEYLKNDNPDDYPDYPEDPQTTQRVGRYLREQILLNYLPRILEASGMLQQANALHRVPVDELDNPNTVQAATSAVAEIEGESSRRRRTPKLNWILQETIPIIERTIQPEHDIQTAEDAVDAIQMIRLLKFNHDPRELFNFDPEERLVELLSSTLGIATGVHPEPSPDPYR